MSRKQHDLTVNTGGEMGQILDHLLYASDPKIRRQDARDALRLHAALRAENERLRRLLSEVAEGGVEFADERVRYVAVQIDAETWAEVQAVRAAAEKEKKEGEHEG